MADPEKLSPLAIREEYIARVRRTLLGPGSEPRVPNIDEEVVAANPVSRYMLGVIYAQESPQDEQESDIEEESVEETVEEQEIGDSLKDNVQSEEPAYIKKDQEQAQKEALGGNGDEDSEDKMDDAVNMATQYKPSSLGFTCMVKGDPSGAEVKVTFGTYSRVDVQNNPEKCKIFFRPQSKDFEIPSEFSQYVHYDVEHGILCLKKALPQGVNQDFRNKHEEEVKEDDMSTFLWSVWRLSVQQREGRIRTPHEFVVPLDFSMSNIMRSPFKEGVADCTLVVMRKQLQQGYSSLTIMLVNEKKSAPDGSKAEDCIFQAELSLTAAKDSTFRFIDTYLGEPQLDDEEEENSALIYRHRHNYATGLGVSTDWEIEDGIGTVRTEYFPQVEVPQMDFTLPDEAPISNVELSMKRLSDFGKQRREEKLDALERLVGYYAEWIAGLERESTTTLDSRYVKAAKRNIGRCKEAQQRMAEGLQVLRNNNTAYRAFELANRAMFLQRVQARVQGSNVFFPDHEKLKKWLDKHSQMEDYQDMPDNDNKGWTACWRPFQIAFLLMDVSDIVDDGSPLRDTVDLIWFPTGGGKTEAYLGLTAFTICYRRLSHTDEESSGTAVIMRYTLRLLTTQQFNRASVMICALELMRRQAPHRELGSTPITLGLWIGSGHTPNKARGQGYDANHPTAEEIVNDMNAVKGVGDLGTVKNQFQVLKCPWCGTIMVKKAIVPEGKKNRKLKGEWGYHMDGNKHFVLACPKPECPFSLEHGNLPLQVVDEELYEQPPTLLFATVDKFAMMSWKGAEIAHFFGMDSEKRRAPELIIQDELHLISGALGTIIGLYETAIDFACQQKGVKPKIVASTATARKAREQCAELYNREVFQFPPSGLAVEDSFFAREQSTDHVTDKRFGRKYIGLMPAGKTKSAAEIRHMAVLLELTRSMQDLGLDDEQMDMLWTLTVYFGSLRNLGHALSQVSDEVQSMVERIAKYLPARIRSIPFASELTSRISTPRLVESLEQLEKVKYSSEPKNGRWATNLLMATNMISVGIDVPRLNQMLVIGQPKLTSEYIQSTSRIGRDKPGVAFVSYNPTNSRDRSHYEQFRTFHQAFYRQVEPSVVTPFSVPALKRALPAVVIAMMWLANPDGFDSPKRAVEFDLEEPHFKQKAEKCKLFIQNRVRDAYTRSHVMSIAEIHQEVDDIGYQIDKIFKHWSTEAKRDREDGRELLFGRIGSPWKMGPGFSLDKTHLLQVTYEQDLSWHKKLEDTQQKSWISMTSMRNVDEELDGKLVFYREEE